MVAQRAEDIEENNVQVPDLLLDEIPQHCIEKWILIFRNGRHASF
jgi:hypothetical protein